MSKILTVSYGKRKRTSGSQWCVGMASWGQKCGKVPQKHHSECLSFFHLHKLAFMLTSMILLHSHRWKSRLIPLMSVGLLYRELIRDQRWALHWVINHCAAFTEQQGQLEIIMSNFLLKAGWSRGGFSWLVQSGVEYLQWWRLHNLPGWLVPVLDCPHGKKTPPDSSYV